MTDCIKNGEGPSINSKKAILPYSEKQKYLNVPPLFDVVNEYAWEKERDVLVDEKRHFVNIGGKNERSLGPAEEFDGEKFWEDFREWMISVYGKEIIPKKNLNKVLDALAAHCGRVGPKNSSKKLDGVVFAIAKEILKDFFVVCSNKTRRPVAVFSRHNKEFYVIDYVNDYGHNFMEEWFYRWLRDNYSISSSTCHGYSCDDYYLYRLVSRKLYEKANTYVDTDYLAKEDPLNFPFYKEENG